MKLQRAAPPGSIALGLALRAARLAAGFGVRELARRAAVHPGVVSSWELGGRIPSLDSVSFLAGVLRLTLAEGDGLRKLVADAHREDYLETDEGSAARLTAAYERVAARVVEWDPNSLSSRLPHGEAAPREVFVGADSVDLDGEWLARRFRRGPECIRLVTSKAVDIPAFTVYRVDGKTPTVALRHAHCTVYLTSHLATQPYLCEVRRFGVEALSAEATLAVLHGLQEAM